VYTYSLIYIGIREYEVSSEYRLVKYKFSLFHVFIATDCTHALHTILVSEDRLHHGIIFIDYTYVLSH